MSATTPWVNPNGTTYSAYGFSFVGCTLEADAGVTGITLAGSNGTAGGLDSWVNCLIDTNAYVSPSTVLSNTYVFWQNNNKDITGTSSISYTNVQTIGVTKNDPRLLAATNPIIWFSGWLPQLAPNTPPVFTAPPAGTNIAINAGVNLSVACTATDSDTAGADPDLFVASRCSIRRGGGFKQRHLHLASAGGQRRHFQLHAVVVTDNGSPNLSATNNFAVSVNPVSQPTTSSAAYSNGQFSMTINGETGPDYIIQVSTNLVDWQSLSTNSSPALPFLFIDTNTVPFPSEFYRVLLGP